MDNQELVGHLDDALDRLLTVRIALGGVVEAPLPEEALDVALRQHEGFQRARRGFVAVLERLQREAGGLVADDVLNVESTAHAMVGAALEVAWRLGLTARSAAPTGVPR